MSEATSLTPSSPHQSPFEAIRRTNAAGNEFWSSRDFARVLGYSDYRNFEQVVQKARMACFKSAHRVEDHFVDVTEMVDIGNGAQRAVFALDDLPYCERRCALPGDEDHFVVLTEMIGIGRDSAGCERRWCLTGDETVGG